MLPIFRSSTTSSGWALRERPISAIVAIAFPSGTRLLTPSWAPTTSPRLWKVPAAAVRHDDELRAVRGRMKLGHCLTRTFPWLLGLTILGTFHLNPQSC